jgi:hypothetical protein
MWLANFKDIEETDKEVERVLNPYKLFWNRNVILYSNMHGYIKISRFC